jgi:hypothetical protein
MLPATSKATHFIFGTDKPVIDGTSNASAVRPGDTIFLTSSTRLYVLLRRLHGTAIKPIVVQNLGGQVVFTNNSSYGVKFDTCSWVKMAGKASGSDSGFVVSNTNAGISMDGLSTCIEVAGFEIHNMSWTGIVAKTDPDSTLKSVRERFTMRNISIHNNYLHDIANEGMYIGSSKWSGAHINYHGKDTVVLPHLIRGLKVYNNRVENTGWDGIQVSSADSACCVNNNYLDHDSQAEVADQMSGFLLGGGSSCNCFANFIKDGKGDGIDELGQGGNIIYNNLIVNAGDSFSGSSGKHGIYVGTQAPAAGRGYTLVFNTIVSPKTNGIDFRSTAAVKSVASDNIITQPGGSYIKPATGVSLAQQNNLLVAVTSDAGFINPAQADYDLKPSSPAVNFGSSINGFELHSDFIGRWRPWPLKYDIGAFECHDSSLLSVNENQSSPVFQIRNCYIKSGFLNVSLNLEIRDCLSAELYSLQGHHIATLCNAIKGPGIIEMEKFIGQLAETCYICIFRFAGDSIARKIYYVSSH